MVTKGQFTVTETMQLYGCGILSINEVRIILGIEVMVVQ